MKRVLYLVMVASWLLTHGVGCTITARSQSQDQGPSNACNADSDCSNGNCDGGVCQTLNGQLEALLIEVTPTADSSFPHIPFVQHVEDLPTSGGQSEIALRGAVHLIGRLRPREVVGCTRTFLGPEGTGLSPSTDGESIPVTVTMTPRESLLGLPSQVYLADARRPTVNDRTNAIEYTYDLQVPAGSYDVYIEPVRHEIAPVGDASIDESCRVPPQLFRGVELLKPDVDFTSVTSATTQLVAHISFPESSGLLEGWVADVIEPLGGHPISTAGVLTAPEVTGNVNAAGKVLVYTVPLAYGVVAVPADQQTTVEGVSDLVRLRPPAGLVAPTIFLDRSGLGLFSKDDTEGEFVLDGFTQFPAPVTVEGQMTSRADGKPAHGYVTLVSTEIFGVDAGIFASFQSDLEVDESGLFSIQVPPGRYRVHAVPPLGSNPSEPRLSAVEASWEVSQDPPFQAGRLLELPPLAELAGQTSLRMAEVRVIASPQTILPFEQAFGAASFVPRATSGLVDDTGHFVVEADPGTFDIAIRPSESSRFAWSVRPGFRVQADSPEQALGRLAPAKPSLVTGVVKVDGTTVVTSALIRAYAYLDENLGYTRDPRAARSVIQVAETRTDDSGVFQLLVPEKIVAVE